MKILVRRIGALGDVILTTPIVRRLKRENPDADISVQTAYPDVFKNNPHVHSVFSPTDLAEQITKFDHIIDLDMAYERMPNTHIIEAYMLNAFGDAGRVNDLQQELFVADPQRVDAMVKRKFVAVHAAVAGWQNRTLPRKTWIAVLAGIHAMKAIPILVGTDRDMIDELPKTRVIPRMNLPDLAMQMRVIASCKVFAGSDSALLHVAGATSTPIVGVFTCAKGQFRLPFRNECVQVVPRGLDCLGCLHHRPPPVTTELCERGDMACVQQVHADDILSEVERFLN